jgi:cytidylate kinase
MNLHHHVERNMNALSTAQKIAHIYAETSRTPAAAVTIALARQMGTPGTLVSREVGRRLGWPVYDHELLERMAGEMGLRVNALESFDERRQNWLHVMLEGWGQVPTINESWYTRQLVETVVHLGASGQCIIVGRGAGHILPPATTLRVRLIGRLEDRIAFLAKRDGISNHEAAQKIENTDRERLQFVRTHFQQDVTDPLNYDLLLNMSRWTVAEAGESMVTAVKQLEKRREMGHTA